MIFVTQIANVFAELYTKWILRWVFSRQAAQIRRPLLFSTLSAFTAANYQVIVSQIEKHILKRRGGRKLAECVCLRGVPQACGKEV